RNGRERYETGTAQIYRLVPFKEATTQPK
ncbi:MAG: hypothetical protein JWP03_3673, partial [Phycisphaerales bacterium]|nr:hypothetical protein [Phycisphaerales bacterium]